MLDQNTMIITFIKITLDMRVRKVKSIRSLFYIEKMILIDQSDFSFI
jgi:hypothetical protein